MRRYAFVDVQNTESTAQEFCGFSVDWKKLYENLCNDKWSCEKVFFYTGIEQGDVAMATEFDDVSKLPFSVVRAKPVFLYKRPDKTVSIKCINCDEENVKSISMGHEKKANCDVELTMDVLEKSVPGTDFELIIMTGDGDFESLIRKVSDIASKVYIVSNANKIEKAGLIRRRFSKKLKDLIIEKPTKVFFVDINNWKYRIKRDII